MLTMYKKKNINFFKNHWLVIVKRRNVKIIDYNLIDCTILVYPFCIRKKKKSKKILPKEAWLFSLNIYSYDDIIEYHTVDTTWLIDRSVWPPSFLFFSDLVKHITKPINKYSIKNVFFSISSWMNCFPCEICYTLPIIYYRIHYLRLCTIDLKTGFAEVLHSFVLRLIF